MTTLQFALILTVAAIPVAMPTVLSVTMAIGARLLARKEALQEVLAQLYTKLSDPDYNYAINTSSQFGSEEPHVHWHLQIRPRLITPAGFEMGTGISINPSLPENDAAFLNKKSVR
jgi:diadenosine tetraphosphate (Ap4A) HIT family hydrolase